MKHLVISFLISLLPTVWGEVSLNALALTADIQSLAPTPIISSTESDPTNSNPFIISINFQATVDAGVFSYLEYGNCTLGGATSVSGDDSQWELDIIPVSDGL